MMEQLLSLANSGGGKHFPDSGPGSKTLLLGDEELGYFGEIGQEFGFTKKILSLILPNDNIDVLDLTGAQDNSWLKFIFKGKVLYTPRRPIAANVSHAQLYDSGMAFPHGVDVPYDYTNHPGTRQDAVIEVSENGVSHTLSARLMRAFSTDGDYLTPGSSFPPNTVDSAKNSEMYNLLFRLLRQVPTSNDVLPTIPLIQTAAYGVDISNNYCTIFSEITAGNRKSGLRYYNQFFSSYNSIDIFSKGNIYFFRPVLETLPNTDRVMSLKRTEVSSVTPMAVTPWCEIDSSTKPLEIIRTFMREQPEWGVTPSPMSPGMDIEFIAQNFREQPNHPVIPKQSAWAEPT